MSSEQFEFRYSPYESQAEWIDSRGSAAKMLENVTNRPVLSRNPPNRHAQYTRYESNLPSFRESIREGDS